METEVSKQMVEELQRLNARVSQLETFSDWAKKMYHNAQEMVHGKSNDQVTQADIIQVLRKFDPNVFVDGGNFTFKLNGADSALAWDRGSVETPFHLQVGSDVMSPHDLSSLEKQLNIITSKRHMHAPADLHAYTSAVLSQQARMAQRSH